MKKIYLIPSLWLLLIASTIMAQVPVITAQPTANTTVTVGSTVTLSTTATVTSGTLTYSLFNLRSSVALMGPSSSPSFTFTPTTNNNGDTYFIKAFANGQTTQSQNAFVYVSENVSTPGETAVQNFGTSAAPVFLNSLGFNTDNTHSWQYSAAASVGATWVRPREPGWAGDADSLNLYRQPSDIVSSELMNFSTPSAPVSGGYRVSPSSNFAQALSWAASNNEHVEMTLDYESPYGAIVYATTTTDNPAGSTTINLGSVTSGSLSNIIPDNSSVQEYSLTQITAYYQAAGTLIHSYPGTGTSVTLEAPTTIDIPAGTQMTIFTSLYPPILVGPQASNAWYNQAGIQGFLNFADAMGSLCVTALASATLTPGPRCVEELQNEPEHSNHLWEAGSSLYSTPPPTLPLNNGGGYVVALAAMNRTPGAGYLYGNGYSDTVGPSRDITSTSMYSYLPTDFSRSWKAFAWQSFHPYGNEPEENYVLPECFKALGYAVQFVNCETIAKKSSSSFPTMYLNTHKPAVFGGIQIAFTETGIPQNCNGGNSPSQTTRARFVARQYAAGVANGYGPIFFYMFSNSTSTSSTVSSQTANDSCNWDFADNASQALLPQGLALQQMVIDVKTMPLSPVAAYSPCQMPQVQTGAPWYYPLAETFVVGSSAGNVSNSIVMSVWQLTYSVPTNGSSGTAFWGNVTSPPAVSTTIKLPANLGVISAIDVVTQAPVSYTLSGQMVTLPVADDLIDIILAPPSSSTQPVQSCT